MRLGMGTVKLACKGYTMQQYQDNLCFSVAPDVTLLWHHVFYLGVVKFIYNYWSFGQTHYIGKFFSAQCGACQKKKHPSSCNTIRLRIYVIYSGCKSSRKSCQPYMSIAGQATFSQHTYIHTVIVIWEIIQGFDFHRWVMLSISWKQIVMHWTTEFCMFNIKFVVKCSWLSVFQKKTTCGVSSNKWSRLYKVQAVYLICMASTIRFRHTTYQLSPKIS